MNRETFRRQLEQIHSERRWVQLTAKNYATVYLTQILETRDDSILVRGVIPHTSMTAFVAGAPFTLNLGGCELSSQTLLPDGVHYRIGTEKVHFRADVRAEPRADTPRGKAWVEFRNPHDQQTLLRKEVLDLSGHGLSFRTSALSTAFSVGLPLQMEIGSEDPEVGATSHVGVVMYTQHMFRSLQDQYLQVGVRFRDATGNDNNEITSKR